MDSSQCGECAERYYLDVDDLTCKGIKLQSYFCQVLFLHTDQLAKDTNIFCEELDKYVKKKPSRIRTQATKPISDPQCSSLITQPPTKFC